MIFHTGFALDLRKVPDSKDTNHLLAPPLPIRWRTQRELSSDEMMTWPQGCKETGFPCDFRHHLGSNKEATAGAAVTALVTTTSTKSWTADYLQPVFCKRRIGRSERELIVSSLLKSDEQSSPSKYTFKNWLNLSGKYLYPLRLKFHFLTYNKRNHIKFIWILENCKIILN